MNAHSTVLTGQSIPEVATSKDNRLNCGHLPTPVEPGHIGTGYAITSTDPLVMICWNCADTTAREEMKTLTSTVAYTSTDGKHIITWSGGELGRITSSHTSGWKFTPTGGQYRILFVKVTDVHGNRWYGRGPAENGSYVSLRRAKS